MKLDNYNINYASPHLPFLYPLDTVNNFPSIRNIHDETCNTGNEKRFVSNRGNQLVVPTEVQVNNSYANKSNSKVSLRNVNRGRLLKQPKTVHKRTTSHVAQAQRGGSLVPGSKTVPIQPLSDDAEIISQILKGQKTEAISEGLDAIGINYMNLRVPQTNAPGIILPRNRVERDLRKFQYIRQKGGSDIPINTDDTPKRNISNILAGSETTVSTSEVNKRRERHDTGLTEFAPSRSTSSVSTIIPEDEPFRVENQVIHNGPGGWYDAHGAEIFQFGKSYNELSKKQRNQVNIYYHRIIRKRL